MVKFALHFKAELENVTDVGPSSEEYEWHFKVKCNNCKEINKNWVGVNQLASNAISGSRGSANFVMHCKFCKREGYAQFDNTSIKPYTIENSGQFSQIVIIDCRGLEFVDFDPRIGFKAKGVKSNIIFNDIDLTLKEDWADYDEEV
ncbi:23656_t:CDS:2 [Cetraspora pellucida]|uniref:23656_t:CDS:1 n=1 Tax=Cetraspora pellucida TaxID=1433469 RepID=A0A9N9BUH1_9GLOM|nr:23656_t:CDS:2 [Cetraspora pellucida]